MPDIARAVGTCAHLSWTWCLLCCLDSALLRAVEKGDSGACAPLKSHLGGSGTRRFWAHFSTISVGHSFQAKLRYKAPEVTHTIAHSDEGWRCRVRGNGAPERRERAERWTAARSPPVGFARACALFFASLALAAPSRTSSEGTDAPVSTRDSLRDVPFEVTALVGFDARNSSVTSIPTTIGGSVEWLGGFQVAFPGEVPETGQSWNDFGGWSALVGDARGERLWTLTDNYAYLLRVDVALDSRTDTMVGVRSIENATDFAILTPRDASRLRDAREAQIKNKGEEAFGDNEGAVKVARRVDVESLVSIPRRSVPTISDTTISDTMSDTIDDVTAEGGDYETGGGLLSDFAVGVEDSWELPANNLIRFARGRGGAWTDVPGADLALNACDANLGPEALVWVPRTETNEAALVTFCETPSANSTNRRDALRGFAFFAAEISDASDANDEPTRESVTVFDLVNVDDDCGLSDASVVPGGVNVLLLFHCYSYPPGSEGRFGAGTHSTQIRVARVADLVAKKATEKRRRKTRSIWSEKNPKTSVSSRRVCSRAGAARRGAR